MLHLHGYNHLDRPFLWHDLSRFQQNLVVGYLSENWLRKQGEQVLFVVIASVVLITRNEPMNEVSAFYLNIGHTSDEVTQSRQCR